MKTIIKYLFLITVIFFSSCSKENLGVSIDKEKIIGNWQMFTSRVILKANDNGKPYSTDQVRNGTSLDYIEMRNDGTINDPNDLFRTKTYSWKYSIIGNELKISKSNNDVAYFSVSITDSKMIWSMNTKQAIRSLKETTGKNSVLNIDVTFADKIEQNDFTIEFIPKPKSIEKKILGFSFNALTPTIDGIIDEIDKKNQFGCTFKYRFNFFRSNHSNIIKFHHFSKFWYKTKFY